MGFKGFLEGGIASIVAGCSTHPLDLIKVRMQLQGESQSHVPNPHQMHSLRPAFAFSSPSVTTGSLNFPHSPPPPPPPLRVGPISVGIKIFQTEGVAALFSGVSATVLRQTLYSTTRMGLYDVLKQKWSDPTSHNMPLTSKITAGLIAGGIGAAVGNPADVAKVRMQADGRLPLSQRRNYKGVIDAITRMSKQEGITSLWRGSSLTINRAMIVTASQLASYDQIKETILEQGVMKDGLGTHVTASFAAGFVAAVASNPVDVIKTRVMNMKVEPGSTPPYSGAIDCAMKTGTRSALYVNDQESFTVTGQEVTPRSVGALVAVALYERAVGIYASLVNINFYHQPGVEAGKKAAGEVLALQVLNEASCKEPVETLTLDEVADRCHAPEEMEKIYKIMRSCAHGC